jgi:hypothetical protein
LGATALNNNGDKVALYVAAVGNSGTGNLWAMNPLVAQNAGSGNYTTQGMEMDVNNFNVDRGGTDGPNGQPPFTSSGINISGISASGMQSTTGLGIDSFGGTSPTAPNFAHGITFNGFYEFNLLADYAQSPTVFAFFGGHTYGIDCFPGVFTVGCIRINTSSLGAASGGIIGRNSANTMDAVLMAFDGTNMQIGGAHVGGIFTPTPINPLTTNAISLGGSSARWFDVFSSTFDATTAIVDAGSLTVAGTVSFTGLPSGVPTKFLCLTSANVVISSPTAC